MRNSFFFAALFLFIVTTAYATERNACRVGEPAIDHQTLALLEDGAPAISRLVTVNGVPREALPESDAPLFTPHPAPVVAESVRVEAAGRAEIARRPRSLHGFHVEE